MSESEEQTERDEEAQPTAVAQDASDGVRDPASGDARDPASAEVAGEMASEDASAPETDEDASASDVDDGTPAAETDGDATTESGEDDAVLVPEDDDVPLVVRRAPRIRTVDFSQPTKFTVELRRRIVRVLGPFCEAFAIRLSSELRAPVELAVADSSQLTWSAAKAQLPPHAIAVALDVQQVERHMLLGIEPSLILQALECLLGGTAAQAPSERKLSEIDWALTRRLLESMTAHLNHAWRDLGGLQLGLGEVDLEGDAGVALPIGEPTFALTLSGSIDGLPSTMSLLIPWSAIASVADEIFGGGRKPEDADPQEGRAVRRGLAGANVLLRAEVGSARMPVEQMLALTPGTLLALEDRAEDGVQLYAEGVPLGRARAGLRGARRAIKLTDSITPAGPAAMHAAPPSKPGVLDGESAPAHEGLARMLGVPVRVWAELGRTQIPLGNALELPPGTVIELDQGAEAPIELFVNGLCFAHGSLEVAAEGEWAVQIDTLV